MARKKINMIQLHSWQECDEALRAIGEHTRDVRAVENVMNEQIAAAKAAATDKVRPLQEQITELELAIQSFAVAHMDDLGGRKSKALTFGTISFRKSTRIRLPKAREKVAGIVARLRSLGMLDCINVPEPTVNREALKKYSAEQIAQTGATLTVEDVFGYELNEENVKG